MENLIDVTFFLADRQDTTVSFVERRNANVVAQVAHLPGVIAVEPYREVPIRIRKGPLERRVMLNAHPADADLSRIIDINLRPVVLPAGGLAISRYALASGVVMTAAELSAFAVRRRVARLDLVSVLKARDWAMRAVWIERIGVALLAVLIVGGWSGLLGRNRSQWILPR
jgi:hypothetical protein